MKTWKQVFYKRIFNLQLHDFLETKMKCVGEVEICKKVETTPGDMEAPQKVEINPESIG